MKIYLRINKKIIFLYVEPSDTIKNVKAKIHDKEGIPSDLIELLYNGDILIDDETLDDCNIQDGNTLEYFLRDEENYCYIIYEEEKHWK